MASSVSISEAKLSNVGQLHFELRLTSSAGAPLAGSDLRVILDGDGSLAPTRDVKEVVRETNADGAARVTWYRRSIFGRDVHATLSVASELTDALVSLQQLSPDQVQTGPRTVWSPERHTFGR